MSGFTNGSFRLPVIQEVLEAGVPALNAVNVFLLRGCESGGRLRVGTLGEKGEKGDGCGLEEAAPR